MYKAKLISADFEESTMEFNIQDKDFIAKKGDYVIMSKAEFEEISKVANGVVDNIDKFIGPLHHSGSLLSPQDIEVRFDGVIYHGPVPASYIKNYSD